MSLAEVFEEEDYAVDWAAYSLVLELHIHTHMHMDRYMGGVVSDTSTTEWYQHPAK